MKQTNGLYVVVLVASLALGGCASRQPQYEGVTFLPAPEDISTSWMAADGTLYLVPEKGVVVDLVIDQSGRQVQAVPDGAYLVVKPGELLSASELRILIERRWRRLPLTVVRTRR